MTYVGDIEGGGVDDKLRRPSEAANGSLRRQRERGGSGWSRTCAEYLTCSLRQSCGGSVVQSTGSVAILHLYEFDGSPSNQRKLPGRNCVTRRVNKMLRARRIPRAPTEALGALKELASDKNKDAQNYRHIERNAPCSAFAFAARLWLRYFLPRSTSA